MKPETTPKETLTRDADRMNRRNFLSKSLKSSAALILLSHPAFALPARLFAPEDEGPKLQLDKKEVRQLFMEKGSCAHLLLYILNEEYQNHDIVEEEAISRLAGGIAEKGYQCGMLWGSSMGASTEIYQQNQDVDQALSASVFAAQHILQNFVGLTESPDCRVITDTNTEKLTGKIKLMFNAGNCFALARNWYPKAIQTANECRSKEPTSGCHTCTCASELVRKMGGSEKEMIQVAGFSGGYGLSGNACGALSAAIWMNAKAWCSQNPGKSSYKYKGTDALMDRFLSATNGEMLCTRLTGMSFPSLDEHSAFIQAGGCEELIDVLAKESD